MSSLLERAQQQGTPLIEGDVATFVWRGEQPPALLGDFNGWGYMSKPEALAEVEPGVWMARYTVRPDAYLEYAYFTDPERDERVSDPFNKRRINNGVGGYNHYFHMPAAAPAHALARRKPGVTRGTVTHHRLKMPELGLLLPNSSKGRDLWLYRPPVDEAVPMLVVLDGRDYLRRTPLIAMVDNLIAQKRIRPIALAMIENARRDRVPEYAMSETTLVFMGGPLLSFVGEQIKLLDYKAHPGIHGMMGASMGGLMSLYAGLRAPQVFGHVISQSGAFSFDRDLPLAIFDVARHFPKVSLKLWLDCGQYEALIAPNRDMSALLRERGYDFTFCEAPSGHNYTGWGMLLPDALEAVYG